ncbi:MAG: DUF1559 domain-containing protein [Planctomycetia bacterium]|nr:DUF1559 domain-containing protein [Planctomycetia bacterium]
MKRKAFTLVELLVVIAIIGMLVGLLLPAVQRARASARSLVCKNNLRQVGIASSTYSTVRNSEIVPGGEENRGTTCPDGRSYGWSYFLLPHLEQQAVFDMIDYDAKFDDEQNQDAAQVPLPVYVCPDTVGEPIQVEQKDGKIFARTSYGGIYGARFKSKNNNNPVNGPMIYTGVYPKAYLPSGKKGKLEIKRLKISEIRDGLSNTLFIAEDSRPAENYTYGDRHWIAASNVFDVSYGINQAPANDNDITSQHTGGAHGVFGDSSVHFLSNSLDTEVLASLCTRSFGDIVENAY